MAIDWKGVYAAATTEYRWYTPLLHLDTLTTLVQCIKLANAEVGGETVRAPRRPLERDERRRVLGIICAAIETRPGQPAARVSAR